MKQLVTKSDRHRIARTLKFGQDIEIIKRILIMPAKDITHDAVKPALEKEG